MKTLHIKFTTQRAKRLPGVLAASIRAFLVALALFVATSSPVLAVDAVWLPNPGSGDWNTGTNWSTSPSAPVNPGDTATFDTSTQTSLTVSSGATVESITFQPGASAFTISPNRLTIQGAGIVNNSGKMQTIINGLFAFGSTGFLNTSTAGNATIINEASASTHVPPGTTVFFNTSSAGSATIINMSFGVGGGNTFFEDRSTAGNATIISNGGTFFSGSSDGGTARAITNGNGRFDISILTTAGMGIGSIEGSGNYFLGSKTLRVGGNNLSTTVSGVIQDGGIEGGAGGSLTKVGTGTLTLTGANTYSGTTTVNSGSLIVDGSVASAQTVVNPGGFLGGHGTIGGNLVNNGIVSPGDPLGTLTVSGNYTQNADGTLRINLASGQHSVLQVFGQATLAGTLQLIRLGPFQLQVGDKLTFLTAKGGVSGTFSTIQNPFISNTIVKAQIVILPNAVLLEGTQGSFVDAACNSNSAAVARALDNAVGDPRAAGLINFLNSEPFNKLCSDFTLIAPEQLASVYNIAVSLANVQTANLERRMDDIRAGSTGFSSAGFTMNGITPSFSGGLGGPTGVEGKAGPSVLAPIPENRWGVFATGLGEFTHVDSTDAARGFDLQTGGFTLGVDYRVCPNFAIGLIAGYAHTNADLANSGNLDVNSGKFGLYATAFSGGFYLDSALTGGISEYDSHRTALLGTASGSTDGGDLNVLVNGGYDWKKGGLSIGPTASFQYTYVSFNGFTESGSLAPLKFNDQHVDSIRTAFGGKASYDWKVGNVLIRPELRAAWQHEYGNSAYSIAASFANGAGSSFTVSSPRIGRDSLLIGAGAAVLLNERLSIYAYYDGELLRTNYQSNNVSAGVRVTF